MFIKMLKSKGVLLSLLVMLVYGVLVFAIYFTGYRPLPSHMTDLPITLVNQDKQGDKLNSQLKTSLSSFKTVHETKHLKPALKKLKSRKSFLVVDIPKGFTKRVQNNQQAHLNFYVNEANQTLVVSGMKNVANRIGSAVNNKVAVEKGKAILTKAMVQQLQQQVPAAAAASNPQTVKQQEQAINAQVNSAYQNVGNSVHTKIHRVNKVKTGVNHAMAPFFISLAAYLGALIGAVLLYGTYAKFARMGNRVKSFGMIELFMTLLAIIGGIIVAWTLVAATGDGATNFAGIWLIHSLEIFAAYNLNFICILLIGQMGAGINIIFTMLQVVAGAGMVPVQLMDSFFKAIHYLSPMYYSIMSDYDFLYNRGSFSSLWQGVTWLALGYLVLNLVIVALRKKQPIMKFEDLA